MSVLDVFNEDAFSMVSLTEAINLVPFQPQRLGALGLFEDRNPSDNTILVERNKGALSVLPTKARGTDGTRLQPTKRDIRPFLLPHIPHDDAVLASEVQSKRAFGSETQVETVSGLVSEKLENMRANHETTFEWHRIGAIKGLILDADGSTLYDLFDAFGYTAPAPPGTDITPPNYGAGITLNFELATGATDVKNKCVIIRRRLENILGGIAFTGILGLCGDDFWDSLISHDSVKAAYDRWRDGEFHRVDQRAMGFPTPSAGMSAVPPLVDRFPFGSIMFENYRGQVGPDAFIPADECQFIVRGVRGLFIANYGPADFIETVNTSGRPMYAKQERMKYDKGVELHSQSNPLFLCTRPNTLIRGRES